MSRIFLQSDYNSRETVKSITAAKALDIPVVWGSLEKKLSTDVPIGDVPFCEDMLREQIGEEKANKILVPDFYPEFLSNYLHRIIWLEDLFENGTQKFSDLVFVKPSWGYKAAPAFIVENDVKTGVPGKYWLSEVIDFEQEWRYYISNGKVLTTGWYDGNDEDEPAPVLNINYPDKWCGAVDFGRLDTGEIALVECHLPFACGHYSDDHKEFLLWSIQGWNWMKTLI